MCSLGTNDRQGIICAYNEEGKQMIQKSQSPQNNDATLNESLSSSSQEERVFSARRASRNASLLMIRSVLAIFIGLFTSRITLNALGVEDYGINVVIGGLLPAFTFIASVLASATSRFLTFEIGRGDEQAIRETFTATFFAHLVLAIILVGVCEVAGIYILHHKLTIPAERMNTAMIVLQFSILGIFLGITQVPYSAVIVAREKFTIYAYTSLVTAIYSFFSALYVKYTSMDKLIVYTVLGAISNVAVIVYLRCYCIQKFQEVHLLHRVPFLRLKPILSFVAWELFGNFCLAIFNQSRNYLVNIFFGLRYNTSTSVATNILGAVVGFTNPIQTAFAPSVTKQYAQGNLTEMQRALNTNLLFTSIVFSLFAVPIAFNAETLFQLWLGSVPIDAAHVLRFILLSTYFAIMSEPFFKSIHATGKMQLTSITGGLYVLAQFIIIYWLYSTYHNYLHAFIVIAIGGCGEIFQRAAILKRVLPELPQLPLFLTIAKVSFTVLIATLPVFAIEGYISHSFLRLVLTTLLYIVTLGGLVYTLIFSKQERNTVLAILQKQLQKFNLRKKRQ